MIQHQTQAEEIGQLDKFVLLVTEKVAAGLSLAMAHEVALNQIIADLTALEEEAVMADRRASQVEAFAEQSLATARLAREYADGLRAAADKEAKKRTAAAKAKAKREAAAANKNSETESAAEESETPEGEETETNAKA